jgi:hypothetical protein
VKLRVPASLAGALIRDNQSMGSILFGCSGLPGAALLNHENAEQVTVQSPPASLSASAFSWRHRISSKLLFVAEGEHYAISQNQRQLFILFLNFAAANDIQAIGPS